MPTGRTLRNATVYAKEAAENQSQIASLLSAHPETANETNIYLQTQEIPTYMGKSTFVYPLSQDQNPTHRDHFRHGQKRENSYDYISTYAHFLGDALPLIYPGNILCISSNIHYAELILKNQPTSHVTLLLIRPYIIKSIQELLITYGKRLNAVVIGHHYGDFEYEAATLYLERNKRYEAVIMEIGTHADEPDMNHYAMATLLSQRYLAQRGTLIILNRMPHPGDRATCDILNPLVASFRYVVEHPTGYHGTYRSGDIFAHFDAEKLKSTTLETCMRLLKGDTGTIPRSTPYSSLFIDYMETKWKAIRTHTRQSLQAIQDASKGQGGGSAWYRRFTTDPGTQRALPVTTTDLVADAASPYSDSLRDFQPRCHWGQKKLLLSEIQFLTEVAASIKTHSTRRFTDYCALYIGAADGTHLTLLYDLFPELDWILIDPARFSPNASRHPRGARAVTIIRDFFTDASLTDIRRRVGQRKLLFISDIRVKPKEELVVEDMKQQARWSILLNSEFMLFKFRLPYLDQTEAGLTWTRAANDFTGIPRRRFSNPDLVATGLTDLLYLDGTVFLQLYAPPYSAELRLFVKRNADGTYPLAVYPFHDIENRIFYYNSVTRGAWHSPPTHDAIPLDQLTTIPGYDDGAESIAEYMILDAYTRQFKKPMKTIDLLYKLHRRLEDISGRRLIDCTGHTYDITSERKHLTDDEKYKIQVWKKIDNMYRHESLLLQRRRLQTQSPWNSATTGLLLATIDKERPQRFIVRLGKSGPTRLSV